MLKYWVLGLTATGVAYLLTPWVAAFARRIGAVAIADQRRIHQGEVPQLGGIAVLVALLVALAVGSATDEYVAAALTRPGMSALWLLAGMLLSVLCGAVDDVWPLSPVSKLILQIVAASFVLLAGFGIGGVTNPFSGETILFDWLSPPVTLLWVVGITNAFNLIDGLDGLAAGVGLIASGTLFVIALGSGQVEVAIVAIALAGALLGFLYFNFHPASVFLGDSGALLLGFILAVLSIHALQKGATAVVIATPILALGLPIADTALAMLRRLFGPPGTGTAAAASEELAPPSSRFAALLRADRDHIHHRLLALGLPQRHAVLLLYAVCLLFNLLAFMAVRARGPDLAILVAVAAVVAALAIRRLGYDQLALLGRHSDRPLLAVPTFQRTSLRALVDAGSLAAAFGTAVVLAGGGSSSSPEERVPILFALVLSTSSKLCVFLVAGVYRRESNASRRAPLRRTVRVLAAAQLAAFLALYLTRQPVVREFAVLLLDFYFSLTIIVASRLSAPALRRLLK